MENCPRMYIFSEASLLTTGKAKYDKGNMKEEFVLQPLDFSAKFLM